MPTTRNDADLENIMFVARVASQIASSPGGSMPGHVSPNVIAPSPDQPAPRY